MNFLSLKRGFLYLWSGLPDSAQILRQQQRSKEEKVAGATPDCCVLQPQPVCATKMIFGAISYFGPLKVLFLGATLFDFKACIQATENAVCAHLVSLPESGKPLILISKISKRSQVGGLQKIISQLNYYY